MVESLLEPEIREKIAGLFDCLLRDKAAEEIEEGEPIGRIITARKATARERKAYEEGKF